MKLNTIKINIKGMTCDHCATSISKILDADGIVEKNVSYRRNSAEVSYDAEKISAEEITALINDTGQYHVTGSHEENGKEGGSQKHLIIIGGGSAAFAATIEAREQGARVTMINDGLPIGGTCVNVGCVPSKNLIRAAETLHRSKNNPFPGIQTDGTITDFDAVMNQKNTLVQELRQKKYIDIIKDMKDFRLIRGHASVISPTSVEVNDETIEGDNILIATGARPYVPEIEGLHDVPYLTSEEAFELDKLPESIIVLGGRYIALEIAQMFARLGSQVTILQRSARILPNEINDLTESITNYLSKEGINIITGNNFQRVYELEGYILVESKVSNKLRTYKAEKLIVATGRTPNTAKMGLKKVGVETGNNESIIVNENLQTTIPSIYAAGDVLGKNMFVYTAAYEGKLAARNALTDEKVNSDYTVLPWVIFTDPQITGVGLDENQAEAQGMNVETSTINLDQIPRAIAARDTRGFIKLFFYSSSLKSGMFSTRGVLHLSETWCHRMGEYFL